MLSIHFNENDAHKYAVIIKTKTKWSHFFYTFQLTFLSQSVVQVMPMFCMNMIQSGMPRPRACVQAVRYMHAKRCYICMLCQNGWHASISNFDQHMMNMHVAICWKKILKWIGGGKQIVHPIARLGSARVGSVSGGAFSNLAIDY